MDVRASWQQRLRAVLIVCAATAGSSAQTFTSLASFNITDGDNPYFPRLVQGTDGNLYGTAENGGTSANCSGGCGTIFKITPRGMLTTLHSFEGTDGQYPQTGLTVATDGSLYGTTGLGGAHGDGVIFKIIDGKPMVLYNFCAQAGCPDGNGPNALVQARNGDFYGTTVAGGLSGNGTIFKITPGGTLTTLYSFGGADGSKPIGALVKATDGKLYGATTYGGTSGGLGTVFRMSLSGTLTSLHSFDGTDGAYPQFGLVQARDGKFYGTTFEGGPADNCGPEGCGTIFQITAGGDLTTLYEFCAQANCADGKYPVAGLTEASDGNLYATTGNGGAIANEGTIFQITPAGSLTTLYSFCSTGFPCTGGFYADATMIQGTDGKLYGTTGEGGTPTTRFVISTAVPMDVEPSTASPWGSAPS